MIHIVSKIEGAQYYTQILHIRHCNTVQSLSPWSVGKQKFYNAKDEDRR